jgi:hypothetical protein
MNISDPPTKPIRSMDGSIYLDGGRPNPAIQSIDRRRAPINERVDPYPAGDGIGRRWPERRWKEKEKGKRGKKRKERKTARCALESGMRTSRAGFVRLLMYVMSLFSYDN